MEIWGWFAQNFSLSDIGIIGGLFFTGISLLIDARTRRVGNMLALTENHRELWKPFYKNAPLSRVLDASADISSVPVNQSENAFVINAIQHLSSVYQAMKNGLTIPAEGIRIDVRQFFTLPIPKSVWEKTRPMQNQDFVRFVEDCLKSE